MGFQSYTAKLSVRVSTSVGSLGSLSLLLLGGVSVLSALPESAFAAGIQQSTTSQAETPPPATAVLPSYRVAPGDTLDISVYQKPELSKQILVPPDGKLFLPFVGEFSVAGLTLGEIKERLTTTFSKQLNNPQISIAIIRRKDNEVSVLGAVKNPGKRTLRDNWRLLDLLADSGGLSVTRPEWVSATLVRGGGIQAIPIDMTALFQTGNYSLNVELMPGDVLLVRELEASHIGLQVLGEVEKPGNVIVPEDNSFASVITSVGGFKPSASLASATLIRGGKTLKVDLRQVLTTGKVTEVGSGGKELKVEPGDTLIVAPNKLLYSVVGAVGRPGVVEYPETGPVTILAALSLAGGASGGADLKNAVLVRPVAGGDPIVKPVNLEVLLKNKKSDPKKSQAPVPESDRNAVDVSLLPGDMLYVPQLIPGRRYGFGDALRDALTFIPVVNLFSR